MKICFVIPTEIASVGCRFLSSYLRSIGHDTRLVFVPDLIPIKDNIRYARNIKFQCSDKLKHMFLELVKDYDIICFSVLAQFYEPLADLSAFTRKKLSKPIVWGGDTCNYVS